MRIHHFNTYPHGGAATAAKRIHRPLLDLGHRSRFFYSLSDQEVDESENPGLAKVTFGEKRSFPILKLLHSRQEKNRKRHIYRQYDRHLRDRNPDGENYAMAQLPEPSYLSKELTDVDIVHLHWISFLADYPSFFGSIPNHVPIVWTLHDMNPFTGGCHYNNGCQNFKAACGNCPQIVNLGDDDVSYDSFRIKRKTLATKNLHVVAPSQWLLELARLSSVWPRQTTFHHIPYGLNLNTFQPTEKQEARKKLGLETDSVLLAFGADDLRNKRKGFQHLLEALPKIQSESKFECLVFGSGQLPELENLPKFHSLGFIDSKAKQALAYSAADVVVLPSLEDNQPQVGLEALACGTPVVGFNAGGIPEYVRHGVTGYLAETGNSSELARWIAKLVDDPQTRQQMSARGVAMIQNEFESLRQGGKYVDLYQSILSVSSRRSA